MRISVRQQLCLILILSGCIGLAALAIATWYTNYNFVLSVSKKQLYTAASLKASQVAFNLELMQIAATFVTTRAILQYSLARYNNGSLTNSSDWHAADLDLQASLGDVGALSQGLVLQAEVFPRNQSGPAGTESVLNVTGRGVSQIALPWLDPNGTQAYLGDMPYGYPPALYPNLTVSEQTNGLSGSAYYATYNGFTLAPNSTLVLGPLMVNATFSLLSITLPVINSSMPGDVLGWITATCSGRLIQSILSDSTGLGTTGQTLLVGSTNTTNVFPPGILGTDAAGSAEVRYLIPLNNTPANEKSHASHVVGTDNPPFVASAYPAVATALETNERAIDDYGTLLSTNNENNKSVSAGYSLTPTTFVDWVVVVEMAHSEVWQPLNRLRLIILACLFSVMGSLFVISFPVAHWFVLPIIRLRSATEQTIDSPRRASSSGTRSCKRADKCVDTTSSESTLANKEGVLGHFARWRKRKSWHTNTTELDTMDSDEKPFRIPGKVRERRQFITDEMSDLTKAFNGMSDELLIQYTKLEDRVRQRTIELEHSKKAAEAANESKTLFVANVSHELKTPLNGILGMCAVSMEEEDAVKLKRSMGIIYKSGDLLLRTLNDLLTFSTNQVGHQQLTLDEREFVLRDLETQVFSIFSEQAKDNQIDLRVNFEDLAGSSTLRDMILWGDVHRLLQVIINLTSNGLKFTPPGGAVTIVLRRLSEAPLRRESTRFDRQQRNRNSALYQSVSSGTAVFINPSETMEASEKTAPPPGRDLFIEFEVADSGPGIPGDMQHKIFEPFVQGDTGLSRKHSGTGLGLSICSQLASLMKGSIQLHSRVGEGSTFTLKVPLRQVFARAETPRSGQDSLSRATSLRKVDTNVSVSNSTPVSPTRQLPVTIITAPIESGTEPATASQSPVVKPVTNSPLKQAVANASKEAKAKKVAKQDFSKVRVLVAEDNKVNQEVILRMLKLEQIHDVTIAEDGQIALDLVKTNSTDAASEGGTPPYDLIFMDVQMPRMDGLTSTKLIRECGFKKPIVALTAFAEQSNIDECYGSGMDYFLAKPVRRPQLKKVLTEYCTPSPLPPEGQEETETGKEKENGKIIVQTTEVAKTPLPDGAVDGPSSRGKIGVLDGV